MSSEPTTALPREKLLSCVHCGLCLDACPTYRVLRHEPDSPRGRIYLMRALQEGRLEPDADVRAHFDLCLNCRACETACPAGVPYGDLIERTRARLFEQGAVPWSERVSAFVLSTLFHPRSRTELVAGALRILQRSGLMRLAAAGWARALLPEAMRAGARILPEIPPAESRRLPVGVFPPYETGEAGPRGRVGLFATCVVQPMYPEVNRALVHLLRVAGCEVVVPSEQTCCGSLHAHAGYRDPARRQARANFEAFPDDLDWIAVASAGCGATLKEYPHLFDGHEVHGEGRENGEEGGGSGSVGTRARRFAVRVRDGLELLDELGLPEPERPVSERVGMHDPCHLAHAQRVRSAPRNLLRRIPGVEVVDLPNSDWCCGSAGIYNIKQPAMADALLEQKLQSVEAVEPTVVSVANPGCLLHMVAGARRRGLPTPFVHPLELLARAYPRPAVDA